MSDKIRAVILGASGYVGGELLRLLAGHPDFELAAAVSESCRGKPIADTFGHLSPAYGEQAFAGYDDWLDTLEPGSRLALFSAAPHGSSAALIAAALADAAGRDIDVHVVDSSADFRYPNQLDYEVVYGSEHGAPELIDSFVCALPEHADTWDRQHVGHPGCFATATLLATVPLVASGLAEPDLFVAGVTGSTGSGRKPQPGTHHPERHSNLYAYKPLEHRHAPEMAGLTEAATGTATRVHFVPHSGPFTRGIHITVHARTDQRVTQSDLLDVYRKAYANAPFVEVVNGMPRVKDVVASNYCRIGVATADGSIVVMSAIDNLVKGAAGGALQWMNRLWGLPETAGLGTTAPGWT
ncbi:MAG: N-acetyl-gamma-glutamyl-phosphate reductase [Woeseiaceae bacterium]|nr:N-acetyl-gamma-glutamyl-phosphate reductase [Woeseiaceae bacterium]